MPLDDEFFLEEDLVTDYQLHESRGIFHLFWESLDEEQDDSLEAMLNTDFTVLADKLQEGLLIFFPMLDYVPVSIEKTANKDPVAVLSWKAWGSGNKSQLSQELLVYIFLALEFCSHGSDFADSNLYYLVRKIQLEFE